MKRIHLSSLVVATMSAAAAALTFYFSVALPLTFMANAALGAAGMQAIAA